VCGLCSAIYPSTLKGHSNGVCKPLAEKNLKRIRGSLLQGTPYFGVELFQPLGYCHPADPEESTISPMLISSQKYNRRTPPLAFGQSGNGSLQVFKGETSNYGIFKRVRINDLLRRKRRFKTTLLRCRLSRRSSAACVCRYQENLRPQINGNKPPP
jgi:hypothetical protein